MTHEERAKAFVQSYGCGRGADYPCTTQEYCPCFDDVVHAFRQAENDKLEEARLIASAKIPKDVPRDEYERGRNNAACEISIEIERLKDRSLKSKDTP